MDQPTLYEVNGGWHAQGRGWAVFGRTQEEALSKYKEAERLHREIDSRPFFYQFMQQQPAQL